MKEQGRDLQISEGCCSKQIMVVFSGEGIMRKTARRGLIK